MICCLDVDYAATGVTAAGVAFDAWTDDLAAIEVVLRTRTPPAAYEPGAFYLRELPFLQAVLARMPALETIIVDGYVWLGADQPGLGKHLHDALGAAGTVVGVAKTRYAGADAAEVVRGDSAKPLFVTAVGMSVDDAAARVRAMHGAHRIPSLLRRVDALARGHVTR